MISYESMVKRVKKAGWDQNLTINVQSRCITIVAYKAVTTASIKRPIIHSKGTEKEMIKMIN